MTLPKVSFSSNDSYLTCRGFLIDKIAGLSAEGLGFFQWLAKSIVQSKSRKSIYGDVASTPRTLYLVMVADSLEWKTSKRPLCSYLEWSVHIPNYAATVQRTRMEEYGWTEGILLSLGMVASY
jgi:hypothetical protein